MWTGSWAVVRPQIPSFSPCAVSLPGCQVRIPERSQRTWGALASTDGLAIPEQDSACQAPSASAPFGFCVSSGDGSDSEGLGTPKAARARGFPRLPSPVAVRSRLLQSDHRVSVRTCLQLLGPPCGSGVLSVRRSEEGRKVNYPLPFRP